MTKNPPETSKEALTIRVGDKLKFKEEGHRYVVRAMNERYIICTKPFNLNNTYFYTIVDFQEKIRGAHNVIFDSYKDTDQSFKLMLRHLIDGTIEISHRNRIDLNIEKIIKKSI